MLQVLPNDKLDFLDAPVPFIVGVKSKTAKVQSKSGNVIYVDVKNNQVKSLSIPHFPQYKELYAALTPYHAQLVGESYLGFYGKRDRFLNAQMCRSSAPPFNSSDTRSTWSYKGATRESKSGRHGSTAWIKATRLYSHLRLMFST
ncbi:uncharacterized protein LOC110935929 isoform X1 [Helianthus annuus]|uniref:uncharacterized protein LOC110935929 isoform X1 n=1 Tax=Helianthus annuus TaxID=4232 RepID=UPI00165318FE|nr:uncharacterized protein LOC110935929 isoform X1 [Helianthus annuus]